ncbi:MAG: response regulator [Clostridiales bacterium]|nr:response regulator [Clostridiales bacterium]
MNEIRAAIAEHDDSLRKNMERYLRQAGDIQVVGSAGDGGAVLPLLRQTTPHVLLIEPAFPDRDGLELLHHVRQELGPELRIVVITGNTRGTIMERLVQLRVCYFLAKPLALASLEEYVRLAMVEDDCPEGHRLAVERRVALAFRELGARAGRRQYLYSFHAVCAAVEQPQILYDGVTKAVYPMVAKKCGVSIPAVEQGIRSMCEWLWEKGSREALDRYFPPAVYGRSFRPSNSAFVGALAQQLREDWQLWG